ncbi:MAG TPA: hypothetical protein VGH09_00285 [Solirubrobacteraceae bacterium]|jgi:hypothetical protein
MAIDKLPSGKYRVRYDVEGARKSKAFTLKRDAERFDRDVHRAIETGAIDSSDADLQTLAELAAEHMAIAKRELEARTFRGYRDVWVAHVDARVPGRDDRRWRREIADTSLRHLTPKLIEDWRNERLKAGAGAQSIRKAMVVMQAMLERAKRDGKVKLNASREVKKPSGKRKGSIAVVSPEKVEQLRAHLDDEGKALVSVLAYSGVRPGTLWRCAGQT